MKNKNIIILSEKSSGSSALQNLISKISGVNHVVNTKHFQNETLYWIKSAAILGMPQVKMANSKIPIDSTEARKDLIRLLEENVQDFQPPKNDLELIRNGWNLLCETYAPIFLEKSPHHLAQWSAIKLILNYIENNKNTDVLLVGLVRNPLDTIYSQYKRWGTPPRIVERQWLMSYRNLKFIQDNPDVNIFILKYEDMTNSIKAINPILNFCDAEINEVDNGYLHQKSINKWKQDENFGFSLSQDTIQLAREYGYEERELLNTPRIFWPFVSSFSTMKYHLRNAKSFLKA